MRADTVNELLFGFTQQAFTQRFTVLKSEPLNRAGEEALLEQLATRDALSVGDIDRMPRREQKLLYELFSQYIMFFQLNPGLPFPDDFLGDSRPDALGHQLLAYIAAHSWPFPQALLEPLMH